MEVMIIMVIFNTFPTKDAEEAGLCRVWGAGPVVLLKWQRTCANPAYQCQGETRVAPVWLSIRTLRDVWPMFATCLSVSGCSELGPQCKRGEGD